jgi:hypothetical protein
LEGLAWKPPVEKERKQIQAKIAEDEQMNGKLKVKLAQLKNVRRLIKEFGICW